MKLYKKLCLFLTLVFLASISYADVPVKGYYKKDGTYVQPHTRHNPSDTKEDKKSAKSERSDKSEKAIEKSKEKSKAVKEQKKTSEAAEKNKAGKEGDISVKGYYRKDGTYVQPYHRSTAGNEDKKEVVKTKDNVDKNKETSKEAVKSNKEVVKTNKESQSQNTGDVSVKGYYRKDGTYVQPYHRSSPNSTEEKGATKTEDRSNHPDKKADKQTDKQVDKKEGDVSVKGYYRKDGTYVKPYHRSSPNKTDADNWSTKGNVNPYTGKEGTKEPKK